MKPQRKSNNSLQINRPVNFNLLDPEEKLDYEFTLTWGRKFATRVKEWVRSNRTGGQTTLVPFTEPVQQQVELPQMSESDELKSVV